jgi:myo-inositol 2-dehydrogenase / D-chiro-inositol 1-dehydrogenase
MKSEQTSPSRRDFLGFGTAAAAGVVLLSCGNGQKTAKTPEFLDQAPDGPELKAGLIGCGGRGTGAALNFLSAGTNLKVVALGDVFQDRLDACKTKLKEEKQNEVADENCFIGFDAYQKVIDAGVDVVLIATPPHFRPEQFAAAVNARKHVFMEKPVAVDPVGARSIMASAKKAESLGLNVVTGTQRRHQRNYVTTFAQITSGAIGEIVSANCYWNQRQLWYRTWKPGWSEMEYMIRDWVNWAWLSGDHIVEQHVHNIDVINWFTGQHPVKAVGMGGRHRRVTGDQYDFFSTDFVYESGMHVHSMCRQIDGCANNVSEFVQGTKGSSNCADSIQDLQGNSIWEYPYGTNEQGEKVKQVKVSPYVQEHIDLITTIRNGGNINEAENTAISTMAAIMARISAYTGQEVTWDQVMNSDLRIGPTEYSMGKVDLPNKGVVPVPGTGPQG